MLKNYQQEALDTLKLFLQRSASSKDIESAYRQCTKEYFGQEGIYNNPLANNNGLFESESKVIPYVCLRLPTGGGKTVLAAHTVSLVCKEYLAKDYNLVLWLVPTNTILEQTYLTLQIKKHFYRQALDDAFQGKVEVMKVEDALHISKSSLQGQVNIIVTTLASWRIKITETRKVYDNNGSLLHHFDNLPQDLMRKLEHFDEADSILKYSLANVVYINQPIIIIDEAHNARTDLTFDTIERLNPSCIVEYTATPKTKGNDRSNVLFSVSAAKLKSEEMIKMPIELLTTEDWQTTISDAVKKQKELEQFAILEEQIKGEYIRPLVLIQAQDDSQTVSTINTDIIKEFLINNLSIPENEIAIATGTERGIEGIDLSLSSCPIRFIITKQALKEGWDCPFAYIFCSVKDVKSSKDIEQLLGRVLRMPKVERKQNENLNKAYAFVCSKSFYEVAKNLTDSLVECGFNSIEVSSLIEVSKQQPMFMGYLTKSVSTPPKPTDIPREIRDKVEIDYTKNTITFKENLSTKEKDQLIKSFKNTKDKEIIEEAFRTLNRFHSSSPQKQGKILSLPQLLIDFEGEIRVFDDDVLLNPKWSLTNCDPILNETEFPVFVDSGTQGIIDLDFNGRPIIHTPRFIQEDLSGFVVSKDMDHIALINWLVNECKNYSVSHAQNVVFINEVIESLIEKRKLHIEHLVFMRFKLRDTIKKKIEFYISEGKKKGFNTLFGISTELIVRESYDNLSVGQDFVFPEDYPVNNYYKGRCEFYKHFYDSISDLNGEEELCAQNIDSNPNVDYWVRNLERQENHSFWLQTSTDKFYPDFVVKLKNDVIVVVEYKGENLFDTPDSREKRLIGHYWAMLTQGKCRFVMLNGKDWDSLNKALSEKGFATDKYEKLK
jgi:type III restriction enzyme